MQRYQWLLFDADGTLFDYERAESAALGEAFRSIGAAFDPGYLATYQRINQALWRGVEKGEISPGFVKVRRFELLLQTIGLEHSPAAFSACYLECLRRRAPRLIEDAAEVVEALQGKYRLANSDQRLAGGPARQALARSRHPRAHRRDHYFGGDRLCQTGRGVLRRGVGASGASLAAGSADDR